MGLTLRELRPLARLHGVQVSYLDVRKRRHAAPRETLLGLLAALGSPVSSAEDVREAVRRRDAETWRTLCEPVCVVWDGDPPAIDIRLPAGLESRRVGIRLELEDGATRDLGCRADELPVAESRVVDDITFERRQLTSLGELPWGYHRLVVESEGNQSSCLLLAAPRRAFSAAGHSKDRRRWGVFAPAYALRSGEDWGAGGFAELEALGKLIHEFGGTVLATLPLMATWLDEPFDPSPYAPISRLFWNEFHVDPTRTPEFATCPAARELKGADAFQAELSELRQASLVDYRRIAHLRRKVGEFLAKHCYHVGGARLDALQTYIKGDPALEDYARFRAVADRRRSPWSQWPDKNRDGAIASSDYDESDLRYHLYSQWVAREQLGTLAQTLRTTEGCLYLDQPLGVHRHGYDTWRFRDLFAVGASGGAPPDSFFTEGQNWGFAPLHPDRLRASGYEYVIACLREQLRYAGMLRIDHVMGLHRLFWVPQGLSPARGAYVQYRPEEWYAILSLESHRHQAVIVGENLGTVPAQVNTYLRRHGIHGTYVVQYELNPKKDPPLARPAVASVATLNTHDMPPFAAFWEESDLEDLRSLGLFDEEGTAREHALRKAAKDKLVRFLIDSGYLRGDESSPEEVFSALTRWLAASRVEHALINLEDLWWETLPQNVPGTSEERPNWRRRMRHGLDEIRAQPSWTSLLRQVDGLRRGEITPISPSAPIVRNAAHFDDHLPSISSP